MTMRARFPVILASAFALAASGALASQAGLTTESSLRALASRIVKPVYPAGDIRAGRTGVAVAELELTNQGQIARVTILEAPSATIADAMTAALRQWEFAQLAATSRTSGLRSRVTFYFVIHAGTAAVRNPSEAGYLGRWPESH